MAGKSRMKTVIQEAHPPLQGDDCPGEGTEGMKNLTKKRRYASRHG